MNRILMLGSLLLTVLGTVGCACYGPGYGYGNCANPCGNVIAPYSCGPSSCGGVGVDYVDGGPGGGNADCGGSNYQGSCGPQYGCGTQNGCGQSLGYGAGSCVGSGLRTIGEGAVGLVAAPFILVGGLLNTGSGGTFAGCGCSNEVYYGDNCYQPHDFCDPCGGNGCGSGCGSAGPDRVGHAYPPTAPGCSRCNGGYSEGIQPGEAVTASTMQAPPQPIRRASQNIAPMSMQRPPVQAQRPVYTR